MAKVSIVIVEDDHDILKLLAYNFRAGGYEVATCETGHEAISLVKQQLPDLVLLDLMIPGVDGFEVCKELKRNPATSKIPVIMLTARGEEVDRIVGLELGADDYVVKPFSPRELMLRVRAVLRRSTAEPEAEAVWQNEGLRVDFEAHKATVDERGDRSHRHRIQTPGGTHPQPGQGADPRSAARQGLGISLRGLCTDG